MKCKCHNENIIEMAIDYPRCQVSGEEVKED